MLYEMAKKSWDEASDPYPIWGTCLGFELLALLGMYFFKIFELQQKSGSN